MAVVWEICTISRASRKVVRDPRSGPIDLRMELTGLS